MKYFNIAIITVFILSAATSCKERKEERAVEGKVKKEVLSFSPKISGRIAEIYVREGQTIHTGDTLARLDIPEVEAKIAQARGAAVAARAQEQMARNGATSDQLKQLKAKQQGLKDQFDYAQKSFGRAENMYRDSLMSPQNYDEVYAKYLGARAQLDAVNAELHDVIRGTRYEKIEMAAGQSGQAAGALQEANTAYKERYIIATNDMEIETISLNKGELAVAGYALFTGYIPHTTYFRFTIPESRMSKYQKGMEVSMIIPYSKKKITGKVVSIKQLARYADITTAFPDYDPEDAVYEIKVVPVNSTDAVNVLVNASVQLY
ncbi:biotin/lipoyl-binding protein [Niabella yanshanensis]|uniref:Biotin/lipoyl-binding protein n=1 Tax=Niabella yanshanensis TaxID=577386 RepID=A0ABZ0WD60_9BACT|nr:biotin/lipoyl-binding protein [Niabella yanshanensis]WQD40532.1 biotin/lipoyl-binding protein [Niabella yanshanensis]